MPTVSIDAMGGDLGLEATVPASVNILVSHPDTKLVLVGDEQQVHDKLRKLGAHNDGRITVRHASEVVSMEEAPQSALRKKKDSSMRVAIDLIKDGRADACVSAGNTGALMAIARFVLRTIPGIDRPAICSTLPRMDGCTHMLDLGANVDSPPEILLQFGIMGSQLIDCMVGNSRPSVGLLNIGVEETKGSEIIKAAAELFRQSDLNYTGFVEADEIYLGDTDLVVCDGVLGNVALKASEGVAKMFMSVMREEFHRSVLHRGSGLIAKPVLDVVKRRLDPRLYNGASLLGLQGSVVKSHGGTDAVGFRNAIEVALQEARNELVDKITQSFP